MCLGNASQDYGMNLPLEPERDIAQDAETTSALASGVLGIRRSMSPNWFICQLETCNRRQCVQLSLKWFCSNRSFRISSSDNLVPGAAVCSLFLDVEALFT